MAVKHIDLDDCYLPKTTDKDIFVDVQIGDGQEGAYSIFSGTKLVKSNGRGKLGKQKDIIGKNTIITVTVVDELRETNWTSITVQVFEGDDINTYGPYKAQAENHLDTVIYSLKLVHK